MLELDGATLTYAEFCEACLRPNRPAIIRNVCGGAAAGEGDSGACFDLATLRRRLSPLELLRTLGPRTSVPVYPVRPTSVAATSRAPLTSHAAAAEEHADGVESDESVPQEEGCCTEVPLETVLQSWAAPTTAAASSPSLVYYLKDWHLQAALESGAEAGATPASAPGSTAARARGSHGDGLYRVPAFLGADWMDAFCRRRGDAASGSAAGFGNGMSDYRFCYMGPVGSWTPLHCDVFGTYSWSFNVCGDKLWYFPTPAGNAYLHEHLPPLFPTPPDMRVLTGFDVEAVVQQPGDLVFVPALYYHQVHNITGEEYAVGPTDGAVAALTVALNHNWCNARNAAHMTRAFLTDARHLASHLDVDDIAAICDCSDPAVWRRFADGLLHSGANWSFASMVCFLDYSLTQLRTGAATAVGAEEERLEAEALVAQLRTDVDAAYARLFEKE